MILIFTSNTTARKKYIFKYLFEELLELPFTLTADENAFSLHSGPKLYYGLKKNPDAISIFENGILNESIIDPSLNPETGSWRTIPVLFPSTSEYDLPFDIFAASFYLLSRYEEYLNHETDEHQRYLPQNSIAYKNHFLKKPVINIWCNALAKSLQNKFPVLSFQRKPFKFISSFDIDSFYAYKGKEKSRILIGIMGAVIRLRFKNCIERIRVLLDKQKDPYDTFELQKEWENKYQLKHIYFFHLGDSGKNDNVVPAEKNKKIQSQINELSKTNKVGLHPSYLSNKDENHLKKELHRIETYSGKKTSISRQHYLKFQLPYTYRTLVKNGIKEDYSMGYAQETGFRAGVAYHFPFFDLLKNEESNLQIYPVVFMDGTLKDYMKLSPEKAEIEMKSLIDEVKESGGEIVSLLHNHTINDYGEWKSWRKIFENILSYANSQKH